MFILNKIFLRFHLNYCDLFYDQPRSVKFIGILESNKYNTAPPITRGIKKRFKEKKEIDDRCDRLSLPKILNLKSPNYLFNLIPSVTRFHAFISKC